MMTINRYVCRFITYALIFSLVGQPLLSADEFDDVLSSADFDDFSVTDVENALQPLGFSAPTQINEASFTTTNLKPLGYRVTPMAASFRRIVLEKNEFVCAPKNPFIQNQEVPASHQLVDAPDKKGELDLARLLQRSPTSQRLEDSLSPPAVQDVVEAVERTFPSEIPQEVIRESKKNRRRANRDTEILSQAFQSLSNAELNTAFNRSAKQINETIQLIQDGKTDLPQEQQSKILNQLRNASQVASIASTEVEYGAALDTSKISKTDLNPLARNETLAEIFPPDLSAVEPNSDLANLDRTVKFFGLAPQQQAQAQGALKNGTTIEIKRKDGSTQSVWIPNLSPLNTRTAAKKLGSSKQRSCTAYVGDALGSHLGTHELSSLDYKQIWHYQREGRFLQPPNYQKQRRSRLQLAASDFIALNLYDGEALEPGDLIFYRPDQSTTGRVALVKSFDAKNFRVRIVEALDSPTHLREKDVSLIYRRKKDVLLKPGIYGLRLKKRDTRACTVAKN